MKKRYTLIAAAAAVGMIAQYGCFAAKDYSDNVGSIELDTMNVSGEGISVDGNVITITEGGDFTVTGSAENTMIYVNSDNKVKLRLSGVNLSNSNGPAIFFENSEKSFITVTEDTENYISDGLEYSYEAKAAIFSNNDLEIKGNGELTVVGNYKHAIASDDDIKIENSTLNLTAAKDGIHTNNTFEMTGGTINITAESDGIQAEEDVIIDAGVVNVLKSYEGIESGTTLTINGGEINIVASDDGLNSGGGNGQSGLFPDSGFGREFSDKNFENEDMQMPEGMDQGGQQRPDGMMRDGAQRPDGNNQNVMRSPRIKQNGQMPQPPQTENNEQMQRTDRINQGGQEMGQDGMQPPEGMMRGMDENYQNGSQRMMPGEENNDGTDKNIYINGGIIKINAGGDGIDSNLNILMTGGEVYVNGPTNNGNGAIDGTKFLVSGGTVIAVGSSGMAIGPSQESEQCGIKVNLSSTVAAGSRLSLKDSSGNELMSFVNEKDISSVVYSSDKLTVGEKYTLYANGEELETIEMTSTQATVGNGGVGMDGGFRGGFGRENRGFNNNRIKVYLDGSEINFDTQPVISDDTTLVPMRNIFESLGMEVEWNEETSTITATKNDVVIVLQIGSTTATKNSENISLTTAPVIKNSRTLIPVRFIAESLDLTVDWDQSTKSVNIKDKNSL